MHVEERVRWKAIAATNKLSHRLSTLLVSNFSASSNVKYLNAPHFLSYFELNPVECVSAENDRQPEQDDCDRHERRASDVSEQDEENRDDGEDCSDVVVHSFAVVGFADAIA